MEAPATNSRKPHWLTLSAVTVAVGASGIGGMALGRLLHFIQHLAYGYDLHSIVSHESFVEGVSAASPVRRLVTLCTWGVAQYPYLVRPGITIVNSAAPSNIVSDLVIAVAVGALILIPSLILLLLVFKTHRESISVDAYTTPV